MRRRRCVCKYRAARIHGMPPLCHAAAAAAAVCCVVYVYETRATTQVILVWNEAIGKQIVQTAFCNVPVSKSLSFFIKLCNIFL